MRPREGEEQLTTVSGTTREDIRSVAHSVSISIVRVASHLAYLRLSQRNFTIRIYSLRSSPPSPLPSHNGFPDPGFMGPFDSGLVDSRSTLRR